jgi:hypothetical protein
MTHTARRLIEGSQVAATDNSYYSSPVSTKTIIQNLTLTNTTSGVVTVTIHLVPSGGTANDASTLRRTKTIAAYDVWQVAEAQNHVLEAGDSIHAVDDTAGSTGTNITIMASGIQIS